MRACERCSPLDCWTMAGVPCMERPSGCVIHRHIWQWDVFPPINHVHPLPDGCPQKPFGICRWYKRNGLAVKWHWLRFWSVLQAGVTLPLPFPLQGRCICVCKCNWSTVHFCFPYFGKGYRSCHQPARYLGYMIVNSCLPCCPVAVAGVVSRPPPP